MTFISFCIPTYNRSKKTYSLVLEILSCQESGIDIIVLDNASTDDTRLLLSKIEDPRFHYFRNEEPILGPLNIINSLTKSNAEYAFLCLDKDHVNSIHINKLIYELKKYSNLSFGFCKLNIKTSAESKFYKTGLDSLMNMSYLSAHPTGMFYKTSYLKNLKYLEDIFKKQQLFGFYPDILNAEMSIIGNSIQINIPVFYTETSEECATTLSFTFKEESDLFFYPKNRLNTLIKYTNHLFQLNEISLESKIKLSRKLFYFELSQAMFGFKAALNDINICTHYYIKPRNVNFREIIIIYFNFCINYIRSKTNVSLFQKIYIVLSSSTMLVFKKYFFSVK